MTYYAQPAAANYNTPPTHTHRQRGYRICDQCGAAETPTVSKFRLCGGCMTTQYCSPDCQKTHWPSHKAICQHTASQLSGVKQQAMGSGYVDENLAKKPQEIYIRTHRPPRMGWFPSSPTQTCPSKRPPKRSPGRSELPPQPPRVSPSILDSLYTCCSSNICP